MKLLLFVFILVLASGCGGPQRLKPQQFAQSAIYQNSVSSTSQTSYGGHDSKNVYLKIWQMGMISNKGKTTTYYTPITEFSSNIQNEILANKNPWLLPKKLNTSSNSLINIHYESIEYEKQYKKYLQKY